MKIVSNVSTLGHRRVFKKNMSSYTFYAFRDLFNGESGSGNTIISSHSIKDYLKEDFYPHVSTYTTNNLIFALDKEKANTRNLSIHFDDGFGDWDHKVLTIT